jgi:PII-like signaling protein
VLIDTQADIPQNYSIVGSKIFGFGSTHDGKRAVWMTLSFFVHVVVSLIADPNIDQLVRTIKESFHQQITAVAAEFVAQV